MVTNIKAPIIIIPINKVGEAGIVSSGCVGGGCEGVSGGEYPFILISKIVLKSTGSIFFL